MNDDEYWKSWWDKKENTNVNNFAKRCFKFIKPNHKTLLDLGCGDGRDSLYFSKKGLSITALDSSNSGIRKLKGYIKKNNIKSIKLVQKNIKDIRFPNEHFDVIYAHLSLHYFDDKETNKIFEILYRILKKGGIIFIKCKSVEDKLYGKGKKVDVDTYIKKHLRHFFSKDYMNEKLIKFKVLKIRKTTSIYFDYKSAYIEAVATK